MVPVAMSFVAGGGGGLLFHSLHFSDREKGEGVGVPSSNSLPESKRSKYGGGLGGGPFMSGRE